MIGAEQLRRQRRLFLAVGIDTVGAGVFMPLSLLFFVTVQHFSAAAAGTAVTAGSIASFAVVPVCGRIVQAAGPKSCLLISNVFTACGYALYFAAGDLFVVAAAAFVVMVADRLYGAAWPTLLARLAEPGELTQWFSSISALRTTCLGAGTLGATALMALAGGRGLEIALALNSASSLLSAVLLLGVTAPEPGPQDAKAARSSIRGAIGDRLFLSLVVSQTLLSAAWLIPTVAFPVYLVQSLDQPAYWPTAVVAVRYATIACLQMPISRRLRGWTRSRVLRLSIGVVAGAIALTATISEAPHALQGPLAVLVAAVLALAELASKPTAAAEAVTMAPTGDEGPYMSLFQVTWTVSYAVGPAVIGLGLHNPPQLWAGLGLCVAASALAHRLRAPLRGPRSAPLM
ncbi:Na+/melibiose symporter-like transporter [Kitasatospora sp. MAA19]|uniref:MFS transporter n=1 Tax=Kitasatospora sp. MAA19 TaxID=3035090 RepID=UPI0024763AA8|nr:MFS transporter [Kitasatospora sp. MAA19]MDH6708841.1 Na+/melibiose symporter-like transporter [Kitasatospora sp. MAA19]